MYNYYALLIVQTAAKFLPRYPVKYLYNTKLFMDWHCLIFEKDLQIVSKPRKTQEV